MTEEQAKQLKPGDTVYVAHYGIGEPSRVLKRKFLSLARDTSYADVDDGGLWRVSRLYLTELEAAIGICDIINGKINQLENQHAVWCERVDALREQEKNQ